MPTDATLRAFLRGSDHDAALQADARRTEEEEQRAVRESLVRLAPFTRSHEGVQFGQTPAPHNEWLNVIVPYRVAHELSGWMQGATNQGKTTLMLSIDAHDFTVPNRVHVRFDYQGSENGYAYQLTHSVIPGVAVRLAPEDGARLLADLRVIAPWQSSKLPSLHLTAPGGNVNVRAAALVDVFAGTTNIAGAGEFGPRMLSLALRGVKVLMKTDTPFPLLQELWTNERVRAALVRCSGDSELEAYARDRLPADFRDAGASVLARLDRFLSDDATRLACFGPEPFEPGELIEKGTTVMNLAGGTPMHRAFWAAFAQTSTLGAILVRRPTKASPRVLVKIDEAHVGLPSADQARLLDDALSRMRGRRASLVIAHQHAGQLSDFPFLRESLRANCGYVVTFRVPANTFAASGSSVPEMLLPGMTGNLTESQNRDVWERVVENLPRRTFLLRAPDLANTTIAVQAPTFEVEKFVAGVPRDIIDLCVEGQGGYDRAELAVREQAWRRAISEIGAAADANLTALERLASGERTRTRRGRRAAAEVG